MCIIKLNLINLINKFDYFIFMYSVIKSDLLLKKIKLFYFLIKKLKDFQHTSSYSS